VEEQVEARRPFDVRVALHRLHQAQLLTIDEAQIHTQGVQFPRGASVADCRQPGIPLTGLRRHGVQKYRAHVAHRVGRHHQLPPEMDAGHRFGMPEVHPWSIEDHRDAIADLGSETCFEQNCLSSYEAVIEKTCFGVLPVCVFASKLMSVELCVAERWKMAELFAIFMLWIMGQRFFKS